METRKIFSAIPKIISEVGCVGKNAKNAQQGYMYRSADDICDALHGSLGKHGVFATCAISDRSVTERQTKNGGTLFYVNLKATYTFHADDGSSVATESWGEAMDSGDKATNKAMTAAYKYALLQVFCLMGHEDSETDSPQPAPKADKKPKAEPAKEPAKSDACKEYNALAKALHEIGCKTPEQATACVRYLDGDAAAQGLSIADLKMRVVACNRILTALEGVSDKAAILGQAVAAAAV